MTDHVHDCIVVGAGPAGLYVWENDQMVFNCEGCLECGSCRVICPNGGVAWRYPRGDTVFSFGGAKKLMDKIHRNQTHFVERNL